MPTTNTIPFELPGFEISQVEEYDDLLVIHAHSLALEAICPDCAQVSGRVHSDYTRSPRDLPCNGRRVRLVLGVRRFRCSNTSCARKTFAERIPQIVPVHGQRTTRLTGVLRAVALEVAAEAGARITQHLKMPMSADTMLRVVRQIADDPAPIPRVLGVDDWAFKKGKNYGTILVDQERQRPIDLLPDRTAETLEAWLKAHPGIEIITRDRSHDYIAGITAGAPHAIQVADRWHLLRNLSDALHRMLESYSGTLRTVAKQFRPESQLLPDLVDSPPRPPKPNLRFSAVKELAAQGYTQRAIARHLNISRNTVKRYLAADTPPTFEGRGSQHSTITPFIAYLEKRWPKGAITAAFYGRKFASRVIPAATAVCAGSSGVIASRNPSYLRLHLFGRNDKWSGFLCRIRTSFPLTIPLIWMRFVRLLTTWLLPTSSLNNLSLW